MTINLFKYVVENYQPIGPVQDSPQLAAMGKRVVVMQKADGVQIVSAEKGKVVEGLVFGFFKKSESEPEPVTQPVEDGPVRVQLPVEQCNAAGLESSVAMATDRSAEAVIAAIERLFKRENVNFEPYRFKFMAWARHNYTTYVPKSAAFMLKGSVTGRMRGYYPSNVTEVDR